MRILIVAPFFPPHNSIGALRPYTWAKYWGRMGHKIDVMTVDSYGVDSGLSLDLKNVNVISTPIPILGRLAKRWHDSIGKNSDGKNTSGKNSLVAPLKKVYRNFLDKTGCILGVRFPDVRDLWANKMIKKYKNNNYDFIISTGCPYSVHKIGYYYKRKNSGLFWIVDWRDLWTKNHCWKGVPLFRPYERYLESRFHNECDLITVVSAGAKDDLQELTGTSIEVVENGFDEEDTLALMEEARVSFMKFTLVYTGTLYKGIQDITPLLSAMGELRGLGLIGKDNFQLITAGNVADLSVSVAEYGLSDFHSHLGVVPRIEALRLIYNSDVSVMLVGKNKKGVLTGKLFEYLSLSGFIFGIDFSNLDDAGRIIKEANAGECFDSDVERIKEFLLLKMREKECGATTQKNMEVVKRYSRKKQAERILSLVDR